MWTTSMPLSTSVPRVSWWRLVLNVGVTLHNWKFTNRSGQPQALVIATHVFRMTSMRWQWWLTSTTQTSPTTSCTREIAELIHPRYILFSKHSNL
eukprot:m.61131 g.61131  ORF g.61131 m.61131 type:complete len:95 (-) comp17525_c0_seq1:167-451(-)